MSRVFSLCVVLAVLMSALPAAAELQNVQVGGELRIRGNYWTSPFGPDSFTGHNPLFQFPWVGSFAGVPGGNPLAGLRWPAQPGRLAVTSPVDWSDSGSSVAFVEQRTKVNVRADFTDDVHALIELDSYDTWGEDFRSDYITGVDARAASIDDVEVHQAYIEACEMFGMPLNVRVGRQELKFGSGWLIGANEAGSFFTGLSFDGVRATYKAETFTVDAVWAKLAETSPIEEDGDVDLYGLYASCTAVEDITFDAYWLLVRDARSLQDTPPFFVLDWIEDVLGVDDYDPTTLHTIGLRAAGKYNAFDFEAEIAYQFGNASAVGRTFAGAGALSAYVDDDADFGEWAANAQVGYTLDTTWNPRLFVGGAYFGGEDNRGLNFWEWLGAIANPFWTPDASVSFNRLFSDWQYGQFVSSMSHDCTNLWVVYGGASVAPTEKVMLVGSLAYVESLADYETPVWTLPRRNIPLFPALSFWTETGDDGLCVDLDLCAIYHYTEDLTFELGYAHLFLLDGAADGNFNIMNGLGFEGGTDDEDTDYFYFDTKVKF